MTLRTKLVLATMIFWAVMALSLVGILRWKDARTREVIVDDTAVRLNNFLFTALSQSMSRKEKGVVLKTILEAMAKMPGFEGAVVADMEGRARWTSGLPAGFGGEPALKELIASAEKSASPVKHHHQGGVAVRLFPAEPSCGSCHPGGRKWLGAVVTRARMEPAFVTARARADGLALAVVLGLFLAGTLLYLLFLRRSLVEPLAALSGAIGSANLEKIEESRLLPSGKDEVGVVVDRFNEMLDRIGRAEKRGKESEARYRRLFEAAEEGILVIDASTGRVADENPAMAALLGTAPGENIGRPVSEMGVLEGVAEGASRLLALVPGEEVRYDNVAFRSRDGRLLDLECSATGYQAGGARLIRCQFLDITEQKSLQAQLIQSQKMESIGLLAGGVAHDFNNILTAILGYTSFLLKEIPPGDPKSADLLEINSAAERAAGLTRQLLAFSRKQPFLPKQVDLDALLSSSAKFIGRIIGEDIRLVVNIQDDLLSLRADPVQLEQVIMNLAANARDAMPHGGAFTIKAENRTLTAEECKVVNESFPGRFLRLSFEDTGTGMNKDILKRIFDPFFTTKEAGKGTGLGLSVVYGIVKQHGGWVNVYSEVGHGTVFHVYLPAQEAQAGANVLEKGPSEDLKGAGQRVLLVEDDPAVRGFTRRILSANGYAVVEASDAEAALELFEKEGGDFCLVFCDTILPGKSGPDLVAELRRRAPDLRVLMTSGYTGERLPRQDPSHPTPFIQKPFSVEAMLTAVKDALSKPPGEGRG